MANNMFGFNVTVTVETDSGTLVIKHPENEIHFDSEFTDDPTPSETTIDIYNLSASTRNLFRVGNVVHLAAGFGSDVGEITAGKIKYIHPPVRDGGDNMFEIITYEGADYSKDKREFTDDTPKTSDEIQVTFTAGCDSEYILQTLARYANIDLQILSLKNNKVYNEAYSASGRPIDALEEVATDSGSKIFYRRGRLMVRDLSQDSGFDEEITLNYDTGLLESPQREEDDDWQGYSVTALFNNKVATASVIKLGSDFVNGSYRVKSGGFTYDGTDAQIALEVE